MNNTPRITRRAALVGAAFSTAALAVPVAAAVKPATIDDLAEKFRNDAMALDPRIKEFWVGYDEIARGPRDMRVMSVYFGRSDTPFVVPASVAPTITTLFPEWNEARQDRDEEPATDTEARMSRYQDLQRRITAMRPRSVREAAMQFVVETDDGDSEYREGFIGGFVGLRLRVSDHAEVSGQWSALPATAPPALFLLPRGAGAGAVLPAGRAFAAEPCHP